MADLGNEVEQQLADLDDGDWNALVARVRQPAASGDGGRAEARRRAEQRNGAR